MMKIFNRLFEKKPAKVVKKNGAKERTRRLKQIANFQLTGKDFVSSTARAEALHTLQED